MKKLVIFGITGFSEMIGKVILADGRPVDAFCVNKKYLSADQTLLGLPIVAFEDLDAIYGKDQFEVLITVGYTSMNEKRRAVFEMCRQHGYAIASFIHSTVENHADSIGVGNIILRSCVINDFTKIGDGNILIDYTVLGHENRLGNFNFIAGATTGGFVQIGEGCFLGMKSIVSNNCTLADHTLLGAGVVQSKDTDPCCVVMPARNRTIKLNLEEMDSFLV